MKSRYFVAAAALAAAAVTLILVEDAVLGGPLSPRRNIWWSTLLQHAPAACAWAAALCVAAGLRWIPSMRAPRGWMDAVRPALMRGIPDASAHSIAAFRVAFAAGAALVLYAHDIAGHDRVRLITYAAFALFAAGLLTRAALVVATVGTWQWMNVWTRDFGWHPVAVLLVALPCLWPVRWADVWSVDAMIRPPRAAPPAVQYGYGIWMPRFVIGVTLLAAATAKLISPSWIANGTVKFAFVADYHRASVPWGLWIASHPDAAVAASAAAVAIEVLAITAAFSRSWVYRLVVGVIVAALFAGFYLLQGEGWRAWWLLLAAFLPWELLRRDTAAASMPRRLSRPQWAAIALLVAQQSAASAARLEIRPAMSAYDMYSTTFASTDDFDRENPMLEFRFEAETAQGRWTEVTECFDRPWSSGAAAAWGRDEAALRRLLSACDDDAARGARRLRLTESLRRFDWEKGEFSWKYRNVERWTVAI